MTDHAILFATLIVTLVGTVLTVYLTHVGNRHFAEQNRIMMAQGGGSPPEPFRVPKWPFITMGSLVLLVWASVGFDIFQRHQASTVDSRVLISWSVGGVPPTFTGTIDGASLLSWKDNYDVAMVCGLGDPNLDRMKDTNISISSTFDIRMEQFPVTIPVTTNMGAEAKQLAKAALATYPAGSTASVPVWFEVVLIPKNIDLSLIHELADVPRYGGTILSQEGLGASGSTSGLLLAKAPLVQSLHLLNRQNNFENSRSRTGPSALVRDQRDRHQMVGNDRMQNPNWEGYGKGPVMSSNLAIMPALVSSISRR